MTLNEHYTKREKTKDEQAVSDFLHWFISNFGNDWQDLYLDGKAEELVQKLWEMRTR